MTQHFGDASLRDWLQVPKIREIEGFPIGSDMEILALSEPPHYAACPNPYVAAKVHSWRQEHTRAPRNEVSACTVFDAGNKTESGYMLHTYHSKIPPTTLASLLEHYTEDGDVIIDPFAGSGMTGFAAQLVAEKCERSLLCLQYDLSPAATFIASVYASPPNPVQFQEDGLALLAEVSEGLDRLYSDESGAFEYTLYSDIFLCPNCGQEAVFWDQAVIEPKLELRKELICGHCRTQVNKRQADRKRTSLFDPLLGRVVSLALQIPVARKRGRHLERLSNDVARAAAEDSPALFNGMAVPIVQLPQGANLSQPQISHGVSHVHHLFTWRSLSALALLWNSAARYQSKNALRFVITSFMLKTGSKLHNVGFKDGSINLAGQLPNTYYIPNITAERNIRELFENKLKQATAYFRGRTKDIDSKCVNFLSTGSATSLDLDDKSVDYCVTDPPFGGFVNYCELSFVWESWLGVRSNRQLEAVIYPAGGKHMTEYRTIMTQAFVEVYRVLKPGRWFTLFFHNSSSAVWALIQEALLDAGFVVADVRGQSRGQGSYKQMTSAYAVKTDLLISVYKPTESLENRFQVGAGTEMGAWDFIRSHLQQLPIFVSVDEKIEIIAERQNYLLFDRMVAFHVQRGISVPLSAGEFYAGLTQRFAERDGMYFLPEQVAEYDKKRMNVTEILPLLLIVTDESSTIQWLKQLLAHKPQTFQDLHPQFMREIGGWEKHERPVELSDVLTQNFLRYGGKGEVPSQIHSYLSSNFRNLRNLTKDNPALQAEAKDRWYVPDLNKASDLEKLRELALIKEFEEYRTSNEKRLKVFRLEAVRTGFKKAWHERDYGTILAVADKIPEDVLQEDPKLLMWFDQAQTRKGNG
jgi:DNA modification methylase